MPEIPFPLGFLHQRLDSGQVLSECLFSPELSRLAASRERAVDAVQKNLEEMLAKAPPVDLFRRRLATEATGPWLSVELAPPRSQAAWREPLRLRFAVVVWNHGPEAVLARVPALGIEVIAGKREELE